MPTHHRKLKLLTLTLGGNQFQCQIRNWQLVNNTEDGEKFYTFCGADETGEIREAAEPDYALQLTFFSDWRLNGINDYLTANDGLDAAFVIDHHVGVVGEHIRRAGNLKIKAPSMGGDARTTEVTEITLPVYGKPTYVRV